MAAGGVGQIEMARALGALLAAGRAYRAIGVVGQEDVEAMVGDAEMALYVRGNDWLTGGLSDVAAASGTAMERGELRSVTATPDALVELWEHAVVVRTTTGDDYELAGDVPAEHDWMDIRTSDGLVSVDLSTGVAARTEPTVEREVTVADLVAIWAVSSSFASEPDPFHPATVPFEAFAIVAAGRVITAIAGSQLLYTTGATNPAIEWIMSPDGVHMVSGGMLVHPPVPPAPSPLQLVWIDGGAVYEVALRP